MQMLNQNYISNLTETKTQSLLKTYILRALIFTTLCSGYLSPRELRNATTLDDVAFYSQQEVEKAETQGGVVYHKTKQMKENVEDILVAGYDPTFIIKHGTKCDVKWLLQEEKYKFLIEMDNIASHPLRQDYRSLADALDISPQEVQKLESQGHDSVTESLLQRWCNKTGKRMTFGMMLTLLKHPGIVGNEEASKPLEDNLKHFGHKV